MITVMRPTPDRTTAQSIRILDKVLRPWYPPFHVLLFPTGRVTASILSCLAPECLEAFHPQMEDSAFADRSSGFRVQRAPYTHLFCRPCVYRSWSVERRHGPVAPEWCGCRSPFPKGEGQSCGRAYARHPFLTNRRYRRS
jgi:hypothetical protein